MESLPRESGQPMGSSAGHDSKVETVWPSELAGIDVHTADAAKSAASALENTADGIHFGVCPLDGSLVWD